MNKELHNSSAQILAAAVLEVFPDTLLVEGGAIRQGFYYDFVFPFSFREEFLVLIEEKMRGIIKEKRAITTFEMVPISAAGLLKSKRQKLRSFAAQEKKESLVSLVQIGEHVDLQEASFSADTGSIPAFKIFAAEPVASSTRIWGGVFGSKEESKAASFRKPFDHKQVEELFAPLSNGHWMWLPKGERLRQALLGIWKEECHKQNLSFISAPFSVKTSNAAQICYIYNENRGGESMLDSKGYFLDLAYGLKEPLQLIAKIFTLCGIQRYRSVNNQFWLEDSLGREWAGPYVKEGECSLFGPLERFVAILLEQNEGKLPLLLEERIKLEN